MAGPWEKEYKGVGDADGAVLRAGDHAQIARWLRLKALEQTATRRPDLLRRIEEDDGI